MRYGAEGDPQAATAWMEDGGTVPSTLPMPPKRRRARVHRAGEREQKRRERQKGEKPQVERSGVGAASLPEPEEL